MRTSIQATPTLTHVTLSIQLSLAYALFVTGKSRHKRFLDSGMLSIKHTILITTQLMEDDIWRFDDCFTLIFDFLSVWLEYWISVVFFIIFDSMSPPCFHLQVKQVTAGGGQGVGGWGVSF